VSSFRSLLLFDVGGGELILIGLVALLLFGGELPRVARSVGRVVGDLRRQAENLTSEFRVDTPPRPYSPPRLRRPPDSNPTVGDAGGAPAEGGPPTREPAGSFDPATGAEPLVEPPSPTDSAPSAEPSPPVNDSPETKSPSL
jgi:mttA/Hcf106 family